MSAPTTADGVEIVVGMDVYQIDGTRATVTGISIDRLTVWCTVPPTRGAFAYDLEALYSTRRAALAARESALVAELEAVRRELAGRGNARRQALSAGI